MIDYVKNMSYIDLSSQSLIIETYNRGYIPVGTE